MIEFSKVAFGSDCTVFFLKLSSVTVCEKNCLWFGFFQTEQEKMENVFLVGALEEIS